MVRRERQQHTIDQHDMLEVVDHALAVEKVHGRAEEVPVQRFGETEASCARRHVRYCNDLLEADDLDSSDNDDHVDVTSEHATEEDADHHESPDGSGNEALLLLLIVALRGCFLDRSR